MQFLMVKKKGDIVCRRKVFPMLCKSIVFSKSVKAGGNGANVVEIVFFALVPTLESEWHLIHGV